MLRQATLSDFEFIYGLYMHEAVNPYLLYEKMDQSDFKPVYTQLLNDKVKYILEEEGERIGMFKLIPLQYRTSHICYLGGLAIDPKQAGKSKGLRMLLEILEFAESKGFLRVELSVGAENTRAIRLYERAGFEKEGVLRNYTHLKSENKFIDEILMSCLIDHK
jgi:L-phenylalanine/L-methionine N-acetyltransferase